MFRKFSVILATSLALVSCKKHGLDNENSVSVGLAAHLKALDPAQASEETSVEVLPNIFETLLQYHYLKRPMVLEPLLAESMPKVSKDGLTATIRLRKGVLFQDSEVFAGGKGRELKAQDFVYSWKRLADPRLKGEGFWIFDGKIKGLNEWRDRLAKGEGKFEDSISGLQTPDDYTLVIRLTRPWYQLNFVLAMAYTSVVPAEAVEKYGEEFMNHPVGTGPFRFHSWVRGNKVVLVKNPTWHGGTYPKEGAPGDKDIGLLQDAGKPLPFVDKLVFHEIPEEQSRWLNFMKGYLDFMGVPKDSFDASIENGKLKPALVEKGMKLWTTPALTVAYCGFNMQDPIVGGNNVELRRALSMAYDTETALKKFYNNQATIAHSPLAPEIEGYDPKFVNPYKEFNLKKAKEHLKAAGYPEGKGLPALEYSVPNSTTSRQMAEYLEQQFGQVGVKVKIVSHSWPQFIERINSKKAQIFGVAWGADYPDQNNMLQTLYGKNGSPGPNSANYKSKEFDALFEKAELMPPGPSRTALYHKMRDLFVQDLPWIPQVHRLSNVVQNGWLFNLKRSDTIIGTYKYLRVDQQKKKELRGKL